MATYVPMSVIYEAICECIPTSHVLPEGYDRAEIAKNVQLRLEQFYKSVDGEIESV